MIALEAIIQKTDELLPTLKNKLKRLNTLQLVNQIIVAVGGASLLGLLQSDKMYFIKYLAASLVLLGSLINIYFQFTANMLLPDSNSFFKSYNIIVDCNIGAQKTLQELTILNKIINKSEANQNEIRRIIEKGNEVAYEIKKCINKML